VGALGATAVADTRPAKPIVDFPIELRNSLPTADVAISGRTFKLLVDLGGFAAIGLTAAELESAGISPRGSSRHFVNSSGQTLVSREFTVPDVKIGGTSVGALQGSEAVFAEHNFPPDRNGYIGFGLLSRFLLVLDYPSRRIRMYPSGDERAFEDECGVHSFPLVVESGITKSLARSDHGELWLLWDTGSSDNVIRPTFHGVDLVPNDARKLEAPPIVSMRSVTLDGNELGPIEFRAIPFVQPPVDGVLGTPFLQSHKICLDLPGRRGAIPGPRSIPNHTK
jgi:hypothetical protein